MRCTTVIITLLAATLAFAAEPTQYDTVAEAIESHNEFSREDGTLEIEAEDHIVVRPVVVAGDFPEVIESNVKREIVYAAMVAFAHTDVSKLTITAFPDEMDFRTKEKRPLTGYKRTVEVTRERFNELVKKYLKLDSAADLIGDMKLGDEVLPNMPLDVSNKILYSDQGYPGLDRFFGELAK